MRRRTQLTVQPGELADTLRATNIDRLIATCGQMHGEDTPRYSAFTPARFTISPHLSYSRRKKAANSTGFLKLLSETDYIGGIDRRRILQSPWRETLQAFDIKLSILPLVVYLYHRADSPMTPMAAAMIAAVKAEAKKIAFAGSRK